MSKTVIIKLNDTEEKFMTALMEKKGFRQADVLRWGLRIFYKREFHAYIKKNAIIKEKKDFKLEDFKLEEFMAWCSSEGGMLLNEEGKTKCRIKKDFLEYTKVYES